MLKLTKLRSSRTDSVTNKALRLHLLGAPHAVVGDERLRLAERELQVLTAIALAGQQGIDRSRIVERIWPGIDPTRARGQLRVHLTRIRAELARVGVPEAVSLERHTCVAGHQLEVDLNLIGSIQPDDQEGALRLLVPFAQGWDTERWLDAYDRTAAQIADVLQRASWDTLDATRRAARLYPASALLARSLVSMLVDRGAADEANEATIAFEDAWVERFGTGDIPTLERDEGPREMASVTARGPARSRGVSFRRRAVWLGAMAVFAYGASRLVIPAPDQPTDGPPVVTKLGEFQIGGFRYEAKRYDWPTVAGALVRRLADGSFLWMVMSPDRVTRYYTDPKGKTTLSRPGAKLVVDRGRRVTVIEEKAESRYTAIGPHGSIAIRGTNAYPIVAPPNIAGKGESVIVVRNCHHPFRDHILLSVLDGKTETSVSDLLGKPQIAAITLVTDRSIYGKYSHGQSDGWKYHPYRYDLATRTVERPAGDPVVAEVPGAWQVQAPDRTVVKFGDYDTRWDGTLFAVQGNGRSRKQLEIAGQKVFRDAVAVGGAIVVSRSQNEHAPAPVALGRDSEPLPQFDRYLERALSVGRASQFGNAMVIEPATSPAKGRSYILVSARPVAGGASVPSTGRDAPKPLTGSPRQGR